MSSIDVTIVAIYLLMLAGMGVYFSRRQYRLEDFFLARRGMSWLPVGLSLMAALNSGIDYVMQPSSTIKFGIVVLAANLSWLLLYPYVFFVTLPMFRRMQVYSAYEYLEHRFGLGVRGLAAAIFMLWRLGWMATALYVPCLVISSVLGREDLVTPMIVALGGIVTISTMLGGIKGVIWTNVMQFFVMFGGLAGTLLVAWHHVPGGMSEIVASMFQVGEAQTVPVVAVGNSLGALGTWLSPLVLFFVVPVTFSGTLISTMVSRLATYTSDQVMVQRFQTMRTIRDARQGFLVTAISDVVWMTSLSMVGLGLFAYAQHNPWPEAIRANTDEMFPYFMSHVFPMGVVGLVIAAILAASLGSIAGAINSLSTVVMIDFYQRIWLGQRSPGEKSTDCNGRRDVLLSRVVTVAMGALGTLISCNVARMGTVFEIANKVINSFTGPLLGMFLLGMFTRRANGAGVFCGGFVGTAITFYAIHLSNEGLVSFLWPSTFGLVATFVVGYLSSIVWTLAARNTSAVAAPWTWAAIMRANKAINEPAAEGCEA